MIRRIIQIDAERCNGCGACASACHEGAIAMVDGKAKLMRDDYCDGLGDCLPACPMDAIRFVEREAAAYDAAAVEAARAQRSGVQTSRPAPQGGCPGSRMQSIRHVPQSGCPGSQAQSVGHAPQAGCPGSRMQSIGHAPQGGCPDSQAQSVSHDETMEKTPISVPGRLENWPVQIKLAPIRAPYFDGAHLLIAADCTAYAYGGFHEDFIRGKTTLIGCPKLDGTNYAEKLCAILSQNDIRAITLTRMQVPCCGALEVMLRAALENSGKDIPLEVAVIGLDGGIIRRG